MFSAVVLAIQVEERRDSTYWGEDEWYAYLSYYEPTTETEDFKNLMKDMRRSLTVLNVEDVYLD